MLTRTLKLTAAIAMSLVATAVPAMAHGGGTYGRYDGGYHPYAVGQHYGSDRGYRDYRRQGRYYGRGYGRGYDRGYRCDSGTGGTIIGAIAGGLLGNEVVGRRGDRTMGTIIGAGVGAVAGRAIDRSDGRRC